MTLAMVFMAIWLAVAHNLPQPTDAASTASVAIDYQPAAARGQPGFTVYDLQAQYAAATNWQGLQEQLQAMAPTQIQAYVQAHKLATLAHLTAQNPMAQVAAGAAVLAVADDALVPFGQSSWAAAMAVVVPSSGVVLTPKPVTLTQSLYFFKYGVAASGQQSPLAGAKFSLTRTVDGLRQWLTADGWHADATIDSMRLFVSDAAGIVSYDGPALGPGDYAFCEEAAPSGYRISADAQQVAVHVPETGSITVQKATLLPRIDGQLMTQSSADKRLWIVNYAGRPLLPNTDATPPGGPITGGSTPPSQPRWRLPLPDTGEATVSLILLGALLIAAAIYLWRRLSAADNTN